MSIYDFKVRLISGEETDLHPYKNKVLLIVNTASQCGLTPQYEGLQRMYEEYRDKGLEILGFPCNQFGGQEPGTSEEIQAFCSTRFGVTFPMFEKIEVNGPGAHPLFQYLKEEAPYEGDPGVGHDIRWNFTKFVVDRDGQVLARYEPMVTPDDFEYIIRTLL